MLVILRIVFGAALLYELAEGVRAAAGSTGAGDTTGAYYLVICVIIGFLNALVWAPYLGDKISGPLTGVITESTYVERRNWILALIRRLDARKWRRLVLALSFLEGVRYPDSPTAFLIGFSNARAGSWLEKVFAREVFRFNHTQRCVEAYQALRRHGIDPRPHHNQEVNILLLALEKPPRPEASTVAVPQASPPAPVQRNPRVRLFKKPAAP